MGNFDHFSRSQNSYFDLSSDKYNNEKDLISLFINEYYNKYGVQMEYYIVSYDTKYDRVFGEDNNRRSERKFNINGYFNLPKEDKVWSSFGIEGVDEITLWVSKRHFSAASMCNSSVYDHPQIGDIIKSDYSNYFYEITEVAEDTGQFLQSNQHIWELVIKPMKNENIEISHTLSASDLAKVSNLDDIFDIRTDTDIEKEDILYKPKSGEKPNKDPFGNW